MMPNPSPTDPFYLILAGDFAAAIRAYDASAKDDPSASTYLNRGLAYLNLGELDRALADFQAAEDRDRGQRFRHDDAARWRGVVGWLKHDRAEALRVWHNAVKGILDGDINMSDAAGGVSVAALVWFAATEESQEQKNALKLLRKRINRVVWPGPIAPFLLGKLRDTDLLAAAESKTADLAARQQCQGHFFVGARAKREGRLEVSLRHFQVAAAQGRSAILECESYLARAEVEEAAGSAQS